MQEYELLMQEMSNFPVTDKGSSSIFEQPASEEKSCAHPFYLVKPI